METINVKVVNKVASVIGSPAIICGNSDYNISIDFDTEWETLDLKTARFVYTKEGKLQYIDVAFSGTQVSAPILSGIDEVYLGVYASNLHTTTPARIICKRSILCANPDQHEEPAPDVYQQLLEVINNLETLPTVSRAETGKALMVNEDGHWVVRQPDFMLDQNTYNHIKFFFGTKKEWETWTGNKDNVLYVPTDDDTLEKINEALASMETLGESLVSGDIVVAEATHAESANKAAHATTAMMVNDVYITQEDGVVKAGTIDRSLSVTLGNITSGGGSSEYAYIELFPMAELKNGDRLLYNGEVGEVERADAGDEILYTLKVLTAGTIVGRINETFIMTRISSVGKLETCRRIFESAEGLFFDDQVTINSPVGSLLNKRLRIFYGYRGVNGSADYHQSIAEIKLTQTQSFGALWHTASQRGDQPALYTLTGGLISAESLCLAAHYREMADGKLSEAPALLYLYAIDVID